MMSEHATSHKPAVTVVIPCYRQARYLADAVDCLKRQTLPDWECIIVNDGSPDNTGELAEQLAEHDSRIRCVSQRHAGVAAARNTGLEQAAGDYVQFLDADDFIAPDKWERQEAFKAPDDGLLVSVCDYSYTDEHGRVLEEHPCYRPPKLDTRQPMHDLALRWETELSVPIHCFLFDARIFREHGIRFDTDLSHNEDWDCWMRVFALNPHLIQMDRRLAFYRLHRGSRTSNKAAMFRSFIQAIQKQRSLHRDKPDLQEILDRKERLTLDLYKPFLQPWSTIRKCRSAARRLINCCVRPGG